MNKILILTVLLTSLHADLLINPYDAIKATYGDDVSVVKKNIMLKGYQAKTISKKTKVKLKTKIYRSFIVSKNDKTIAHAIIMVNKIRTKNAVVLYMIDINDTLRSVEIIAFNEPPEFMPNDKWLAQFDEKTSQDTLRLQRDISTITGATLSARSLTQNARLALGIVEIVF